MERKTERKTERKKTSSSCLQEKLHLSIPSFSKTTWQQSKQKAVETLASYPGPFGNGPGYEAKKTQREIYFGESSSQPCTYQDPLRIMNFIISWFIFGFSLFTPLLQIFKRQHIQQYPLHDQGSIYLMGGGKLFPQTFHPPPNPQIAL